MAQYFFKMTNEERDNILNQHKTIYDGYVTEYGQQSNTQPLYVQDYANDKEGLVVSNKGVVKPYTNMGINESKDRNDNDKIISKEIDEYLNKVSICDKKYLGDDEEFILYAATDISEMLYEKYVKKVDSGDEEADTARQHSIEDKFEKLVRLKYGNKIKKYFRDNIVDCVDPEDYKPTDNLNYDDIWNELQESHTGLDMIADKSTDMKNGTVDLSDYEMMHDTYPSPNEDEFDFISLGLTSDDEDNDELGEEHGTFDHMSDEYEDEDLNYGSMKRKYHDIDFTLPTLPDFEDDVEEEILPDFMEKLNESLDMFNRFKKYN